MSDQPMTAEEIRREWRNRSHGAVALGWLIEHLLSWMSAREREHAELRERVERLEAKVMGDGR